MKKLPRYYNLFDAGVFVLHTHNLWFLGVMNGSTFWFWFSLIALSFVFIPSPGEES
jgi:hypothetical protein